MQHDRAHQAVFDLAPQQHAIAFGQRFLLAGVKVKEAGRDAIAAVVHRYHQLAARAVADFAGADGALDLHHVARPRIADFDDAGFILIPQGHMQGKVHGPH